MYMSLYFIDRICLNVNVINAISTLNRYNVWAIIDVTCIRLFDFNAIDVTNRVNDSRIKTSTFDRFTNDAMHSLASINRLQSLNFAWLTYNYRFLLQTFYRPINTNYNCKMFEKAHTRETDRFMLFLLFFSYLNDCHK